MSHRRIRPFAALFAALLGTAVPLASQASLPATVDGQALPSLAPMLEKVTPAVVNISTKTRVQVRDPFFDDPVFRQFFGLPGQQRERVAQSLGSGVIVDAAKGYILTNNHVVGGADDITVSLQDGRDFKGKLIGTDPDTDVAVVQIQASGERFAPSGSLREARLRFERDYIASVLKHHGWHMTNAAQTLGIQRPNLYRKARQLGIPLTKVSE